MRIIEGMGAPWTLCTTPGPTQYLMSGDGNGKLYKMSLDGKLLGWAQTSLGHSQSGCLIRPRMPVEQVPPQRPQRSRQAARLQL